MLKPVEESVRWNIKVSKDTDLSLRTFLGSRGMKKGDLSKFIERAVRAQIFHHTIRNIKSRNVDMDEIEFQSLIDSSLREVRRSRRAKRKLHKR